ncbi:type II toxin-antitoxin system mRNA interferase toxin [Nostoc sphaeroides CCNUC1]|uniref:Type II toxin-antitoxin system mRNA interferase toxin n=1 Tax=Nostoc sphaeroides CCNUC1 TaxID=2653204 RepID=A0A5P8VTF7_9NOSO|nr:type II toxin-antitoxin system mRNA interferase toxin [Nostoc sphaeroides CCNUC1]
MVWSPTFVRAFKRLVKKNPELRSQIEQVLEQIAENPFQLSLRSHKLKGDSLGRYSCSIDYRNRILFKIVTNPESGEEEILLLTLGSHDEVY